MLRNISTELKFLIIFKKISYHKLGTAPCFSNNSVHFLDFSIGSMPTAK